jgi:NADH:ubiquinone oxidoreductase subunit
VAIGRQSRVAPAAVQVSPQLSNRLDNSACRWHHGITSSRTGKTLMKLFLLKIFTWWNGQTFGTQLWTWRFGELVGQDEQGNTYYRTKGRKIDPTLGFERRWVVYNGYAEASKVPPSWHGWLHHTVDVAPTEETYTPREWEKPHQPNLTGTAQAYRPPGSIVGSARPKPKLPMPSSNTIWSSASMPGKDGNAEKIGDSNLPMSPANEFNGVT